MLHNIVLTLQVLAALGLLILMAVQTDKAEQGGGGVMGLGAAGGRAAGEIDMVVGAERILKPLTKWTAIGFLFLCVLSAAPAVNIFHLLGAIALFVLLLLFGDRSWLALTGARR